MREKNLCSIVLFNKSCRWSLFYRNYGGYLEPVPRGGSGVEEGWKRGGRGVVAGVRCGVRSALPTQALSAPPLIAVFVAAQPISLTPTSFDPFHPSPFASPRIRMFMRPGHQQIFLRFLDHCFPYAPLLAPSFNHALFPLARMPTIAANNLFKAPEWNR